MKWKVVEHSRNSHSIEFENDKTDIKIENSNERKIVLSALQKAGFNRFGIGRTFIHVDNDTTKPSNVIWLY